MTLPTEPLAELVKRDQFHAATRLIAAGLADDMKDASRKIDELIAGTLSLDFYRADRWAVALGYFSIEVWGCDSWLEFSREEGRRFAGRKNGEIKVRAERGEVFEGQIMKAPA